MAERARHFARMFREISALSRPQPILLAALGLLGACTTRGPQALPERELGAAASARMMRAAPRAALAPSPVLEEASGPRLFPPLDGADTLVAGEELDESQRLVAQGLRVLLGPGGELTLAREYLPAARTTHSLRLPTRLGGGFLFYVLSSSATLFFRARTFTGDLEPFARLDFEAEQVVPGFDRLYVLGSRSEHLTALDTDTGAAVGLGSLPPSPGFGKMAFADAWFGAVQAPFRGNLVTFDAGASWHRLSISAETLAVAEGQLVFSGADGVISLSASGALTRRAGAALSPDAEDGGPSTRARPAAASALHAARAPSGQHALKEAVLRGLRDRDGTFVVASAGSLLRVRPSDGKVLEFAERAYAGTGECTALRSGRGFVFACADGPDQTALYAFESPLTLRRMLSFPGPRSVASSGNGALVIRGGCSTRPEKSLGAYCIVGKGGALRQLQVRGDLGVERVVALADGRVAVLVPPRFGASGFLSLFDERGHELRVPLKLPNDDGNEDGKTILDKGLWLDGFQELPNAVLAGWAAGAERFAGVRVTLAGEITVSRPESSLDRALLSGTRALTIGATGRAMETTDGGFSWSEFDLPSEFDAGAVPRDDARLQGCSELGCAFAGFLRVGWKTGSEAPRLRVARLPEATRPLQTGGGRWSVHCEPTGERSEPALALRNASTTRAEDGASAPWLPFFEWPAPTLAVGEAAFDSPGSEPDSVPLHAYAWGERGTDWGHTGRLQIRALDRFRVTRAPFQSALTQSPWPDADAAAAAFGFDGTGNPTLFRALLETGQRAGAVVVSSRGTLDLLLFEEGRSVTRLPNVARFGIGMLTGITKVGDAWYAASFNERHALTLSKIVGNRIERLAEYADPGRESGTALLARGVHGDALGIWVMAAGWYLFPIELETGVAQAPFYESPANLAKMPPPCPADADGFLLSGEPSLQPSLRFPSAVGGLSTRQIEAQLIWSARGLCTRALAADTESVPRQAATFVSRAEPKLDSRVPLALIERRPEGRRWGFLCGQ